MSFSSSVKKELSQANIGMSIENIKAEIAGYLISKNVEISKTKIKFTTENEYNINRFAKLLEKININYNISIKGRKFSIICKKISEINLITYEGNIINIIDNTEENKNILKCILKGAFLCSGSINAPTNKYHLEIKFKTYKNAIYIFNIISKFNITPKILIKDNNCSIYLKEGEEISKFLALLEAYTSVIKFEEIRVIKETRNNINRIVNCETANISKTINAATEQLEAIQRLKAQKRFEKLSDNLKEIANLRLKHPQASLNELSNLLKYPISKSGINHRLKNIIRLSKLI